MNKMILSVFICLTVCLSACSAREPSEPLPGKSVSEIMEQAQELVPESGEDAPKTPQPSETAPDPAPSRPAPSVTYDHVEEDLSVMSGTMVYAKVMDMLTNPDQYLGKVVRIKGLFAASQGEGRMYFACVIPDATACCSQGMEFVLKDEWKYPDEYPSKGTVITVTGIFDTYMEGTNRYCQLNDAVLE